ncbi:MAG: hypothetical protein H5T86_12835 [Armatimonadetes bacterium]|nr:hypothetical protein [Armatimonadota bacterium]
MHYCEKMAMLLGSLALLLSVFPAVAGPAAGFHPLVHYSGGYLIGAWSNGFWLDAEKA